MKNLLGWFLVLAVPVVLLYLLTIPRCEQCEDASGYTLKEYLKLEPFTKYRALIAVLLFMVAFSAEVSWPYDFMASLGMMLLFETILFASVGSRKSSTIVLLLFAFACAAIGVMSS